MGARDKMSSSENEKYKIEVPGVEFFAKEVECREACPVGTDAGAYVRAIGRGDFEKAYAIAAADVGVLERSFSLVARYLS